MENLSPLLALCAGYSPVTCEFPAQRPVIWSLDVFFDLRPNKRLRKHSWGRWFGTPSCPLWRHSNNCVLIHICRRECSTPASLIRSPPWFIDLIKATHLLPFKLLMVVYKHARHNKIAYNYNDGHDGGMLSATLDLCAANPPVTGLIHNLYLMRIRSGQ